VLLCPFEVILSVLLLLQYMVLDSAHSKVHITHTRIIITCKTSTNSKSPVCGVCCLPARQANTSWAGVICCSVSAGLLAVLPACPSVTSWLMQAPATARTTAASSCSTGSW